MEKRTFVTSVITDSMLEKVRSMDVVVDVQAVDQGIESLKNVDFISALKDEALVKALKEKGVETKVNPIRVMLLPGDVLYVINPGIKLYNLGDGELPKYSTITMTRYEVFTKADFVKKYISESFK